ncbi:lyase family protein [Ovoidimarina sediminis]|uniref:lyase family protein n=1 Tax=Ovoidimarina sediminis TaxID=3079856 RepID=UPI00290B5D78|nr:lyase family protein [Rhodophyticola sp. MJ-SS7]MDU8946206.1 lyase family protein [Rhodophyticola sp. MJ-SS7]
MPATPLDSALYADLMGDPGVAHLFGDSAEVRAMLLVLGALAEAQGAAGIIPETSAAAIKRASHEVQIDPAGLSAATGANAVPVPALVAAFRAAMNAPEHAQYIHWGATSQDIMDTALVLRLRQVLAIAEMRLVAVIRALGDLAGAHADLPMTGRTYGQAAVPTSFGALVASWGAPLLGYHAKLTVVREDLLHVSLSGAAGTLSVLGDKGPEVRATLARALKLKDPGASWHTTRDTVAGFGGWATGVLGALGKMGEDLILLTQSGIGEVALKGTGASSTMPQKANPVAPSVLSALARLSIGLNAALQGAALHRQQRDGAAWMTEWLTLPQIAVALGRGLTTAGEMVPGIAPVPGAMARNLDATGGAVFAEALSFALTAHMARPEAQAEAKALAAEARDSGRSLEEVAGVAHPDLPADLFDARAALGQAPAEARGFAAAAAALKAPEG